MRYLIAFFGVFILWFSFPNRARDPSGALFMAGIYATTVFGGLLADQFFWIPVREKRKRARLLGILALAAEGRTAEIKQLINSGVSVDLTGPYGETALLMAARNNQVESAIFLLAAGTDRSKRTKRGSDAAAIARKHGNIDLALLISGKSS